MLHLENHLHLKFNTTPDHADMFNGRYRRFLIRANKEKYKKKEAQKRPSLFYIFFLVPLNSC